MTDNKKPVQIVLIHAGVSDPSTTQMIADRLAEQTVKTLRSMGREARVSIVALSDLANDITTALVAGFPSDKLQNAIDQIAQASGLITATPVYKAGISGLFKAFFDLLDNDLIIATPVAIAATAGSPRHALVVDDHMRPLFAFMRALTTPTSVTASPDELSAPELTKRIERAATELAVLINADIREQIQSASWGAYEHKFGGDSARAEHSADDVNFDTDLMRLARGER